MECKCGAVAHSTKEKFTNQRTAEEASGKSVERLPVIVVKNKCQSCGFGDIQLWYPDDSQPIKRKSLLDLMRSKPTQ